MKKKFCFAVAATAIASFSTIADDSINFHAYGMVAGNFEQDLGKPKNLALHMDPTGPNQDPRGKMGELGNNYWHDYFVSLAINKRWDDIVDPGQWADFTYEVVGYGDKGVETAQMYVQFGGLDFMPQDTKLWAGRRYTGERIGILAYNIREVNVDSGVGYLGKNVDITIGYNQIDWSSENAIEAAEGSRNLLDVAYRLGNYEFGGTYVHELDDPIRNNPRDAFSVFGKYTFGSYFGLLDGQSVIEAQAGRGVIAQYLNTNRISALSEEKDISMRLSMFGTVYDYRGLSIESALIYEYTDRDEDANRMTYIRDTGYGGIGEYGSATETGIFAAVNVKQPLTNNISLHYEAVVNNTTNKDGRDGATGTMYKLAFGPAIQLKATRWAAPVTDITVSYVGGEQELTNLDTKSEWVFGYRAQIWF